MNEDVAKKRFMILNLVRFSALAFIFAGAANIGGKLLPDLTPTLGYILLVIGAIDFFLAPVMLKRMWRTPEQ
jgi:hypothetical protein